MAYIINKTNGSIITTVADGTIDQQATSITLVGQNYAGYGEFINENFVKLLENFSSNVAPTAPLAGQLWWDTTTGVLKAYTGVVWKNIPSSSMGSAQPVQFTFGDLWWDTTTNQLKVCDQAGVFRPAGGPDVVLSGDITGAGSSAITTSLSATGVTAGNYGTASSIPTIAVDAKGRITTASNTAINIASSQVSNFAATARTSVSANNGLTYNSTTGVFGVDNAVIPTVTSMNVEITDKTKVSTDGGNQLTRRSTGLYVESSGGTVGTVVSSPGEIIFVASTSAPDGCLIADGSAVSRTTYAALFAAVGTTFGAGDGSTTFLLPDLRGEFIRGWDNGRGIDAGRAIGSNQADSFKSHTHLAPTSNGVGGSYEVPPTVPTRYEYDYLAAAPTDATGGVETRPRNIAMLGCIRYKASYGVQGATGGSGLSAYQVAVANGFVGSEAAWLASLASTVQYASNAEAQALSLATKVLSPSTLATALQGANQSLSTSGYQKLPGGLILQWGEYTVTAGVHTIVYSPTFPIAFPNAVYQVVNSVSDTVNTGVTLVIVPLTAKSLTGFSYQFGTWDGGSYVHTVRWFAIGK